MTTLQSKTSIGDQTRTIIDCLNNMRGAFTCDEALRWGFCIQTAFLQYGYNADIDKAMREILALKGVPPIFALPEKRPDEDFEMPPVFINKIFKIEFNQNQLKQLWCWIKEYSLYNISNPYQYLSLLLFLEYHHSIFLQKPHLFNTDMQDQMRAWFPMAKVRCSADAIGTYRSGFFNSDRYEYISWLNTNGEPPAEYELKTDQSLLGFQTLVKLCNNMELNLSELKI